MPIFEAGQQRAQVLIGLLALALAIALWPYLTGLIGALVLFVIFGPLHRWLTRFLRPAVAAGVAVAVAVLVLIAPALSIAGLVVREAQQLAGGLIRNPVFGRLTELHIGQFEIGPHLVELGQRVVAWIGDSAFNLIGTATRLALNLSIALFGLYFLLLGSGATWRGVRPYVPFSAINAEKLRERFTDVTYSTLVGLGLTAVTQGVLVGAGFAAVGLPNAFLWGVVTAVFAILPIVGSGLVWGPGAVALFLSDRYVAAVAILLWGLLIVASVDNVVRPIVYRKWAKIHPLVTLVGALAGIKYFGILGLLIGPLALSYFFQLIAMYREEYLEAEGGRRAAEGRQGTAETAAAGAAGAAHPLRSPDGGDHVVEPPDG